MLSGDLTSRANRAVHGLLLRAEVVSEALAGDVGDQDRRDMLAVLGGLQVMASSLREVASHVQVIDQQEFEAMLRQADISMDRVDEVFA